MNKSFVKLHSSDARKGNYSGVIKEIQDAGVCPFCPDHLTKYHKNPILLEGDYWLVTTNMYPYDGAVQHFLLIHKNHVEHITEVEPNAWDELKNLVDQTTRDHKIEGGTLIMRFGDTTFTGGSVSHLHGMIVSGTGETPVLARVG